jgi:ABC-2 type transport system ATP-binding protein
MATIGEPELMILDEPTNGLDPSGIKEIRDLLTKLNKEKGVTMIISSHILSELSKFATSYIFIDSGKIMDQVSAIDMEKKVGKIIQIVTDNVEKTTSLFNEKDVSFTFDGKTFCIKDVDDVLAILNMLQAAGIKPLSFKEEENALEDYYLELLGGNENA